MSESEIPAEDEELAEEAGTSKGKKANRKQASDRPLMYDSVRLEELAAGWPYAAAIDFETTGFVWGKGDRIIEVSVVLYDPEGNEVDKVDSLVKVDKPIPPAIVELTGITDEMLALEGRPFADVMREVQALLTRSVAAPTGQTDIILVGHNLQFDACFLYDAFEELAESDPTLTLPRLRGFDTWHDGSWRLWPDAERHTLEHIAGFLGENVREHHRAYSDSRVGYQAARLIVERFRKDPMPEVARKLDFPHPVRRRLDPALRQWRAVEAAKLGVPEWKVLTHYGLERVLIRLPQDDAAFAKVEGITPSQAERYRERVLEMVREATAAAAAA